ncbi:MAG: glycosyltransferase family 2 protein, partial [Prochloraceae cyanobacterium]
YNCAESTGATVVGPLMCQDEPVHKIIHFAGGESRIVTDINGKRHIREKMYKQGQQVVDVLPSLQRTETALAEFHCVLVGREIFESIGNLDPKMLCTKEHLDFCMTVREAGGKVYFEPEAIVTYVQGLALELSDIHFYMLRWSDAWTMASLEHFREKWQLTEDNYFRVKYKKLGSRRKRSIIKPVVRKFKKVGKKVGIEKKQIENFLLSLDRKLNHFLTNQYNRKTSA